MSDKKSVVFCLDNGEKPPAVHISSNSRPMVEGQPFELEAEVAWVIEDRVHFEVGREDALGWFKVPLDGYQAVVLDPITFSAIPLGGPMPSPGQKYKIPARVQRVSGLPQPATNMYEVLFMIEGKRSEMADRRCGSGGGILVSLRPVSP